MIVPVHQDPADLVLTIVTGRIETPLTILKQDSMQVGAWLLKFHIIGESHLVTIEHDGRPVMCELLACVDSDAASCLHQHHFDDLAPHCFAQTGYSIDVDFDSTFDAVPALSTENALEMSFPEIDGCTPITRIVWNRISETAVRWQTLHVYPFDGKIIAVRSLSYFDALHYNQVS